VGFSGVLGTNIWMDTLNGSGFGTMPTLDFIGRSACKELARSVAGNSKADENATICEYFADTSPMRW
jgi:hypothetical protein